VSDERYVVARVQDIPVGARLIVDVAGRSVGIFNVDGEFYAMLNTCPHKGAELCKGDVLEFVASTGPGGELTLDSSMKFLVCPWHGWEYDLRTGESWTKPRRGKARPLGVAVEAGRAAQPAMESGELVLPDDLGSVFTSLYGQRVRGEYQAEVVPLSIEDDYLVVTFGSTPKPTRRDDDVS
jgi:nitrite reductase/ring-hydroxylating ferredoxin subunit